MSVDEQEQSCLIVYRCKKRYMGILSVGAKRR